MNVQCREAHNKPWLECECFDSIAVNGTVIPDMLYIGYQIDIANHTELNLNDTVEITIYHQRHCDFRIMNPNDFIPRKVEKVQNFRAEEKGILKWKTIQNYPQLRMWVQIEQYRWDEWVKIGDNHNIGDSSLHSADITKYLFKGKNEFRAVVATIDGERIPSEKVTVCSKQKKVKCKQTDQTLKFSENTYYEIYNENHLIADRGFALDVNLTKLNVPEGKYIVRYGNKTMSISIE